MRYRKLVSLTVTALLAGLLLVLLPAGGAQAAEVFAGPSWSNLTFTPDPDSFDSVSVDLATQVAVNSSLYATHIRFKATVSADQAATRVSIERVALAAQTKTLFVWQGHRLGPSGVATVGPSYPWSPVSGCYYRMRINYSVRWPNGVLTHHAWLTGWGREYWARGC